MLKAVDDAIHNMYGMKNPRRECNYGPTDEAKLPSNGEHSYSWFVMTEVGQKAENVSDFPRLNDAIEYYQQQDTGNKRIGVTKSGTAMVDILVMLDGEQQFLNDYLKLDSFQGDELVYEAVETIHNELDTPEQGMTMKGTM